METKLRGENVGAMRSVLMLTVMLLGTLAAPAVQWDTGNDDLNDMLAELLGPIGVAQAANFESDSSTNPADHIEVVSSADLGENIRLADSWEDNDNEEEDWCMGDFFMINITQRYSYFAVCWGSEDNPGPVTIAALEVQYLGGINLHDFPAEGMTVPGVPLPIATVFATSLVHMIEFEDTGTPGNEANTSGNGVFDFVRAGDGLTDFEIEAAEPVHAGVDLSNLNWDMTDDGIEEWAQGNSMGWNFTLEATNVGYDGDDGWWLTDSGDEVERIAYTFHLGVEIDTVTDEVIPWWDVTLDPVEGTTEDLPWEVENIGSQQNLTWSGVRVGTDFKYDQTIEGWDFHSEDSLLMVESVIVRGSFTFGIIGDFMDEVSGQVGAFDEDMAFDVDEENEVVLSTGDVSGVNRVAGTNVEWRNDYRKVPDQLHWVDTAEVGEDADNLSTANVTFQLHASEAFTESNDDAIVTVYVALGGAIYPAANHIFHDPGYASSISLIQLGGALLSGDLIGLQLVVVGLLGALGMVALGMRRRSHKKTLAEHHAGANQVATRQPMAAAPMTVAPSTDNLPSMGDAIASSDHPPGGGGPVGPRY
uniref:Uncharacterized protein n=1 Tax=uncultured marine group II/III euryarchaeote KM3_182_B06 TaxID=1457946 RepID=A0A075GUA7_9EURY|nr:hypothetical protein [uncultured marine group II/III euryarchaeote KM3_182_B06]